ncbi:hypothetical protein [Hydrogenophaga sp.]|uniref:hypothetical protein n=1 Tax=Hydrogenophaga sp. TaxID=1904254 RepID=UPI00271E995F|nr:hypothetical protein [Hydrogenophaga sp.]MDO8906356.1 hypothetical protein [Hydrogenophaga sp.]
MIKNAETLAHNAVATASDLSDRAAREADQTLVATRRAAADASKSLREGFEALQEEVPSALARAAAQAEALSKEGLERARRAKEAVREQALRAGDQTVNYIKDEPVKAVAIAAGVGAVAALLVGWLGRSSRHAHANGRR